MSGSAVLSVAVQMEDFSVEEALRRLRQAAPGAGAEVAFVGLVRDQAGSVASLTLEHYPGMSERSMLAVCERAAKHWPLLAVEAIHRVGTLGPGDQIVLVLVSSAHRHAAFEGAQYIMDAFKSEVVFWKLEDRDGEKVWIEAAPSDQRALAAWEGASGEGAP